MATTILLKHPTGKKAVSMDKNKYDSIKKSILNHLTTKGESTHADILQGITQDFKKKKIKFEGSLGWHMEWVKLDMEARKEIKRISDKSPIKFVAI